jgi:YHS domain-containing protein
MKESTTKTQDPICGMTGAAEAKTEGKSGGCCG